MCERSPTCSTLSLWRRSAFQDAGATKHGDPRFFWNQGETLAVLRAEVQVRALEPLTNIPNIDAWRIVERFERIGATEHGPCNLLIYNNHQPSSDKRPFKEPARINFCKAVLKDAHYSKTDYNIGFGFGGDANCDMSMWTTAFKETSEYQLQFTEPCFMTGIGQKNAISW